MSLLGVRLKGDLQLESEFSGRMTGPSVFEVVVVHGIIIDTIRESRRPLGIMLFIGRLLPGLYQPDHARHHTT